MRKNLLLAGVAGAALLAFAPNDANAQAADCMGVLGLGDGGTLDAWANFNNSQCRDQDKLYTLLDTDMPFDTTVFVNTQLVGAEDVHNLVLGPVDQPDDPNVYTLSYSVEIVDNPDTQVNEAEEFRFNSVSMDANVPAGGQPVEVIKEYDAFSRDDDDDDDDDDDPDQEFTLTSSGGPDGPVNFTEADDITRFVIDITVNDDGIYNGLTNTYTEQTTREVPAPASLLLFGVGLGALGFVARKRSA